MQRTAASLFKQAKDLWPEEIDLNGMPFGDRCIKGLQILNELRDTVEDAISIDDDWMQVAVWSFHQALWSHAEQVMAAGQYIVRVADVELRVFDEYMKRNLQDDTWDEERAEYLRGNAS